MDAADLEDELDELYRAPPTAFVGARNELARKLKLAGRKSDADGVAKRVRPTPMAWVVNQLWFEGREELDALLEGGARLREAQEVLGDSDEFAKRKRTHQVALKTAADRGIEIADGGGLKPNPAFRRKLELTLNLLSAASVIVPPPGRMSADLEPSGFDALSGAAVVAKRSAGEAPADRPKATSATRAALAAVEKELLRLEDDARSARTRHERAGRILEDAEKAADAARTERDLARAAAQAAEATLKDAHERRDAALSALKSE